MFSSICIKKKSAVSLILCNFKMGSFKCFMFSSNNNNNNERFLFTINEYNMQYQLIVEYIQGYIQFKLD